ncbi:hypothetical protein EVAR_14390_1 [Eumeta japonica]|uniref:Uncharacterized protein n=1 Tax=Eumeta variegata TaxID=151549 RepID=A0A4C1TX98_EUMVA|nr:hypothetical protein EVAR_14390_1 [Eumeta japonica]
MLMWPCPGADGADADARVRAEIDAGRFRSRRSRRPPHLGMLCAAAVSFLLGRIGRWSGGEIARSALSLARSAQAERDNESCFFVRAAGVHRFRRDNIENVAPDTDVKRVTRSGRPSPGAYLKSLEGWAEFRCLIEGR